MSTPLALCLPEIVSQIIGYLVVSPCKIDPDCVDALWSLDEDSLPKDWEACAAGFLKPTRNNLHSCILLNHVWSNEARRILWAVFPPLVALLKMEPHRRPLYAREIQSLCVYNDSDVLPKDGLLRLASLSDVAFPKLHVLKVADYLCNSVSAHLLVPFMASRLKELDIYGSRATVEKLEHPELLFNLISARCTHLRAVRFFNDRVGFPSISLLESIDRGPSMVTLALHKSYLHQEDFAPSRLVLSLQLCNLRSACRQPTPFFGAIPGGSSLFQNIRELMIEAAPTMIIQHYHIFRNIEVLKLRLASSEDTLLAERQAAGGLLALLSELACLRDLEISYLRYSYLHGDVGPLVTGTDLVILAERCRHLRRLCLDTGDGEQSTFDLQCANITDECLMFVASHLRELEDIQIYNMHGAYTSGPTEDSIRAFAENCSHLRVLKISGEFDYSVLDLDALCLFPHLQSFGRLEYEEYLKHKPILNYHFPQLQEVAGQSVCTIFLCESK